MGNWKEYQGNLSLTAAQPQPGTVLWGRQVQVWPALQSQKSVVVVVVFNGKSTELILPTNPLKKFLNK